MPITTSTFDDFLAKKSGRRQFEPYKVGDYFVIPPEMVGTNKVGVRGVVTSGTRSNIAPYLDGNLKQGIETGDIEITTPDNPEFQRRFPRDTQVRKLRDTVKKKKPVERKATILTGPTTPQRRNPAQFGVASRPMASGGLASSGSSILDDKLG